MNVAGRIEIVRELCSFRDRLAGTDAERRAANRFAERLRGLGRPAEVEPIYVHPQLGLVYAAHCLLALAGSLVAVEIPVLGFGLVLLAATSMYLDLNAGVYLLRRLFFRRASQNVVSRGRADAPARLVISAHLDAGRTGIAFSPASTGAMARVAHSLPFTFSPSRLLFWGLVALVPVIGVRAGGVDSGLLSVLQLPSTLILIFSIFALVEIELSEVSPAANDNASGVATAISLAEELRAIEPANLDVWVVLTGGGESLVAGMRSFVRAHRSELSRESTYVLNLDSLGAGEVRFVTAEGPAVTHELDSRLTALCDAIAEGDSLRENRFRASPLRHGFATDALPARLAGLAATTITCVEPGALYPANVHTAADLPAALDPATLERAHGFALELIRQLDRYVGLGVAPADFAAAR